MKKLKNPLIIIAGIILLPLVLVYGFFGAAFGKQCALSYNAIGVFPFQEYDPELITPVPESEIFSAEDVRHAIEITEKEARHYLDRSDYLYPWRTAWIVKMWYDPALDEITDDRQIIYIRAQMYSCSDRNWWCNVGFDESASFSLVRTDAGSEWKFRGLGRC